MLTDEATVADVAGKLNKLTEYIRRVVEHMWECKRQCGMAFVRIGVTGAGRAPNYRIEYRGKEHLWVFGVHNGLSHRKDESLGDGVVDIDNDKLQASEDTSSSPDRYIRREHWSTREMPLEEVAVLLGKLRVGRR